MKQWRDLMIFLNLLSTLILSIIEDIVKISKTILSDIQTCLQDAQEKIEFLQLESQFQLEELQQNRHHSEPVSVHNIQNRLP